MKKYETKLTGESTMFELKENARITGTSLAGYIGIPPKAVVEKFGPPMESHSDDYKVSACWTFESPDGKAYTLYNWKNTSLYDPDYQDPEAFLNQTEKYKFHIGAHNRDIFDFRHWLIEMFNL